VGDGLVVFFSLGSKDSCPFCFLTALFALAAVMGFTSAKNSEHGSSATRFASPVVNE